MTSWCRGTPIGPTRARSPAVSGPPFSAPLAGSLTTGEAGAWRTTSRSANMARASDDIRNLAVIGHGHAGKTTLVDAIAHHLNLTTRLGSTADGTSISDTEPEEKERHQTLASHVFRIPAGKVDLEVFDTPGHPDFYAEALGALDVVETAVLVINASNPLTFHARQLWEAAGRIGIGRAIVVTHLDQDNANFEDIVAQLRDAFGHSVVPATYPNANGKDFDSVYDVTHDEGPLAPTYHEMIEEDEAEVDDTLMEHYLEEGHLSPKEFEDNLRRARQARTALCDLSKPRSGHGTVC
ncbi:MAG TPA: GTP-binding protein [Planctomycetes bacterium]|nr:GTP-binding protein [Planctomycetota bacterium]